MKLTSLLNALDDQEMVLIWDDNASSINVPPLFKGKVKDCKYHRSIGNGVVKLIVPMEYRLDVFVDIEYQKNKAERKMKGGAG